jgi:ABC-type dipeptide/oligopeptide/nickel transport system ATPase component
VTDFVEAAYGSGGTFFGVLWRHILPNSLTPVIALAALQFGSAILQISTLGFLGYGAPPPTPEWGLLIAEGRNYVATAWWLTVLPGIVVVLVVLATNRLSQALRGGMPHERAAAAVHPRPRRAVPHASGTVDAVRGVSFDVEAGSVTALVGESGSGKTTVAQTVIGLLASNGHVSAGSIRLTERTDGPTDLVGLSERRWRHLRGRCIALIPQDPGNSLNPVATIGWSVGEALRIHGWKDRAKIRARVIDLLERVGIDDPETRARQYPHELSGGMRQRVLIAAALALRPELIIADEPTSALDVTVQRTVLDLLDELRAETGTGILFITHDLAVAADRSDALVVMRGGRCRRRA